jgi:hypothetical protein
MPPAHRNLVRWLLLDDSTRVLHRDWAAITRHVVGILRMNAGRHPCDSRIAELVGELGAKSEDFRRLWADHHVVERGFGTQRFRHPLVGDLELDYEVLMSAADPEQVLLIYIAKPGSPSQEVMNLLVSWAVPAQTPLDAAGAAADEARPHQSG